MNGLRSLIMFLGLVLASPAFAFVTIVSSSSLTPAGNSTGITLSIPTGLQASDFLLAQITVSNSEALTAPAGWSLVRSDVNGVGLRVSVYSRFATASEPASASWSWVSTAKAAGGITAYRGVDTTKPIDASAGSTGNSGSLVAPSVTTAVADSRLVTLFGLNTGGATWSAPTGMTPAYSATAAGSTGLALLSTNESRASIGATGPRTATSVATGLWVAQSFVLKPGVALTCVTDQFDRSSLGTEWAVSSRGATYFLPSISGNRMRLTSSAGNVSTAANLQRLLPAAGNYVRVQFRHYAYGGTGADGIAVVFSDATVTPQPGSAGGPLGYGFKTGAPGFAGGWVGVGIDEFGNYSTEGGPGGPGKRADSVAIRGSGSGTSGYRYIAGTSTLSPGIDSLFNGPGYLYRITIDSTTAGQVLMTVERDTGAGFSALPNLNRVNVLAATGQVAIPQDFFFSLTGSTGGSTNVHELDDLEVCAKEINPVGQQIDHFEFAHSGGALTCTPLDVTIRACIDASCSKTYTSAVTATFTPSGWVGGDSLTFSGGSVSRKLKITTGGTVTLGVTASVPALKPLSQALCSSAGSALSTNCNVTFASSGFVLDVPDTLAVKPTTATIKAVNSACAAVFSGVTRKLKFTSAFNDPSTGTQPVVINGTSVTSTATDVSLAFDSTGTAPMTIRYDDAGQMTLSATYNGSTATGDAGLVIKGTDLFVARPYGLLLETDTDSSCTANISCPSYPGARAGDPFSLKVKAVGWQADGEALTAAALANNTVTPNFRLDDIALSSQVLAPVGGSSGALTVSSYNHALGNQTTVSQSISEVGVFSITATPTTSYFGSTVSGGTSGNIGRFIPKYLGASGSASLTPACGSAFSYQGQQMQFASGLQPALTLTGQNAQGAVTTNYDRGSFWRMAAPSRNAYESVTGKASLDAAGRLTASGSASAVEIGADTGDGARTYSWSGETLSYSPASMPSSDDLPFTAAVRQGFSAAALTDADGVCFLNGQASCQAYSFDFVNNPGSQVRLGRLRIDNAHGSELQPLMLPLWLESWQSVGSTGAFRIEPEDTCSGPLLGATTLGSFTGNLQSGDTAATVTAPLADDGSIRLSAPGAGNDGGVRASLPALTWLWYDWSGAGRAPASGLASFGVYQGSKPLIFRREQYRVVQ